ncbi:MAG: hypothetical protein ACRCZZ_10825 [Phocaeicola sp.]
MIQKIVIACCLFCLALPMQAQRTGHSLKNGQRREGRSISREEFCKRQASYLTEKAKLTEEEAEKFFPLFFELQEKKKEINNKAWKKARNGCDDSTTEKEYDEMTTQLLNARLESDKLDLEYNKRYKEILSAKKIFFVQMAEMRFRRDLLKEVSKEKSECSSPIGEE